MKNAPSMRISRRISRRILWQISPRILRIQQPKNRPTLAAKLVHTARFLAKRFAALNLAFAKSCESKTAPATPQISQISRLSRILRRIPRPKIPPRIPLLGRLVLRLGFYASGGASRLLRLFEKNSALLQNTHFIVFDSPPNAPLEHHAAAHGIELCALDYPALGLFKKERNAFLSETLLAGFRRLKISHCFCFGRLLLEGELLRVYENKIINFHPSLLPHFAGQRAIDRALEANAFLLGNTAHFVDAGLDSGPIIMQSVLERRNYRDYESVLGLQIPMIEQIFAWLMAGRLCVEDGRVLLTAANLDTTANLGAAGENLSAGENHRENAQKTAAFFPNLDGEEAR